MNALEAANPIARRIDQMTLWWAHFRSVPEARVCQWIIDPDEKAMIGAFLEATLRDEDQTDDFFLPFYTGFTAPAQYSRQLVEELGNNLNSDREAMEAEGLRVDWQPEPFEPGQDGGVKYFLRHCQRFAQQCPAAQRLVAVLAPVVVTPQLATWLAEALRAGIPANLRLLVISQAGEELPEGMASRFPGQLLTQRLNLDMPEAVRQLATAGDPTDPGVKFRKAFLEVAQAASDNDLPKVKRLETLPLAIARQHGWLPMEIAVHGLVAAACIGADQLPEALQRYERAFQVAQRAKAAGEKSAATLAIQCLLNQGSVGIGMQAYPAAAQAYANAAELAEEAGDYYQVMEAKRLRSYCLEQTGEWAGAFEVAQEALVAAERLEENIRHHSTLPYLGQSLLDLAYRMGEKRRHVEIEEKMKALAGANWQKRLNHSKAPAL